MMKLGSQTGSLVNHVMSRTAQPAPKVGDGATVCGWTDRHAATVVKVTPSRVTVQMDKATRTDSNDMSEMQTYSYECNPAGNLRTFSKTKSGWRATGSGGKGNSLSLGFRQTYRDYSF